MIQFDNTKNIVKRILSAYKLKTVKALCLKWGITPGVIASRIQRQTFPADYVIKCMLDTGADLSWLCTGEGESGIDGINTEKKSIDVSIEA
ncbi:helix-turn-helix domain-containing protein, partial [Gilliamella sp. B2717]|uniref:helix-turn-helix domain-containing protein n=1 Tax=Gilliamella sp. B2717 TaxID=2817996 RepID=UPI002269ED83